MTPINAQHIADVVQGKLAGNPSRVAERVCTDSRQIQAGDLFVALKGDNFDGHSYVAEVAARGASIILAEDGHPLPATEAASVLVPNTRAALGLLAANYRAAFDLPVIAVAGSNGKTTTKEIIATVLRKKLRVIWSEASFNNDIGVPMSLLRLDSDHQAGVFEAGSNHPGELMPLLRMIAPKYAVITSIGREHLEHFGNMEGVVREEGAAAEVLPETGKLFVNGDSEHLAAITARCKAAIITVGTVRECDWRVADVRAEVRATVFNLQAPDKSFSGSYRVPLLGLHQAVNAAFAIAVAADLGLSKQEIQAGLLDCKPAKMRLQLCEAQGIRILDDSYNANADSMIAALRTLAAFPCQGRRVAVLGDMAELGTWTEAAHAEVGRCAAELGVGQLFAVGPMASHMAQAARRAGLHRVLEFPAVDGAVSAVCSFVKQGDVVLIKASRVMRLERIADALKGTDAARKN